MKNRKNAPKGHLSHSAFTMIELVFVIVILGILAAVAIPRFAATRIDAQISKGRADVSSIRSAIITERQSRLITGDSTYISGIALNTGGLFAGVLTYPITSSIKSGHWNSTNTDTNATATMDYNVAGTNVGFTYTRSTGIFTCSKTAGSAQSKTYCGNLID